MDIGYFIEQNKKALIAGTVTAATVFYSLDGCDNVVSIMSDSPEPYYRLGEEVLRPIALGFQAGWSTLAGAGVAGVYGFAENAIRKIINRAKSKNEKENSFEHDNYDEGLYN